MGIQILFDLYLTMSDNTRVGVDKGYMMDINELIDCLDQADVLMQKLGLEPEVTYDFHNRIQNLLDDIEEAHAQLMGIAWL